MTRSLARAFFRLATLPLAVVLVAACSATSPVGDAPPPPVLWTYESVSWYNRYSLNSTVGPLVLGRTVIYGGTYSYQNTKASRLAALDPVSGRPTWRMEHAGGFGPLVVVGGTIVVASEDSVLGLDVTSGTQRWAMPLRARTLTAGGPVVLVAERQTIHALDPASGRQRWQVASGTDPAMAGDTVLFMEGRTLHAADASTGADRWTLELPPALAYPQSVAGDHLYLLGATALGSVSLSSHRLEWVAPLPSAPTTGIARADDTLFFTTQTPAGSYVFHAFDPAARKDRWTRALDSSSPVAPVVMGDLVATAANSDEQSLIAMARASGAVTWQARAGSVPVPPVVKGGVLYVAGQGPNRVYAFEAATGTLLWSGRLFGFPMGMALTEEGTLLVSADNLTLYAYRTREPRRSLGEDAEHVDLDGGRDRDRAIERSSILPDLDELLGLPLAHAPDLDRDVDGLKPIGLGVAADALDGDLHARDGDLLLEGVLFDEGDPARGDAREERLTIGQGLVGTRGRIQHEVIVTGAVERASGSAARIGTYGVDLHVTSHWVPLFEEWTQPL